jgi:hypothetical protein
MSMICLLKKLDQSLLDIGEMRHPKRSRSQDGITGAHLGLRDQGFDDVGDLRRFVRKGLELHEDQVRRMVSDTSI